MNDLVELPEQAQRVQFTGILSQNSPSADKRQLLRENGFHFHTKRLIEKGIWESEFIRPDPIPDSRLERMLDKLGESFKDISVVDFSSSTEQV